MLAFSLDVRSPFNQIFKYLNLWIIQCTMIFFIIMQFLRPPNDKKLQQFMWCGETSQSDFKLINKQELKFNNYFFYLAQYLNCYQSFNLSFSITSKASQFDQVISEKELEKKQNAKFYQIFQEQNELSIYLQNCKETKEITALIASQLDFGACDYIDLIQLKQKNKLKKKQRNTHKIKGKIHFTQIDQLDSYNLLNKQIFCILF
ncbi:transmembrane protein, putative (macronuclear) [Tetrahymena thermophila SB210]|uniref:Transmembrane protein, putative n=1 Tax=Tetrahymena thermophila (strain SB210) TaxID=312017 RepID=W7XDW5_TETTS|nr:transmembrane protein, putative [Tetrahymena thermophila SB210]EWS71024.1 transmembrane protein, putative [Tetrahymena thermophila SB210]|eukprot:XP_012656445.1 transmembrane protein, putative [Tetrahymena thermophila SB210]